jgi:chromosomal replication initiation ATPase DnaA
MTRSPSALVRVVAEHYSLDITEVTAASAHPGPTASRARRVVTYVLRSRGRSWGEIGRLLGFRASSAMRAYRREAKKLEPLTVRLLGES